MSGKLFEHKDCLCSKQCINAIGYEDRKANFDFFWKLASFEKQNLFLSGLVRKLSIKQRRPRNKEGYMRKCSYKYHINIRNSEVSICRTFFLDTFKISYGRLNGALNAKSPGMDLRGKMPGSSRKTDEDKIKVVREHILSFPACESHYTRSHHTSGRKYLSADLDIRKMYELYVKKCDENNISRVKEWTYRKIFNTEFNLNFHTPRKDTCQKCDLLKLKIEASSNEDEKLHLMEIHNSHLNSAEQARKILSDDIQRAKDNPSEYYGFTFDLQKALPYPKLSVSVAYYKRNMYVYNLGFHNFHNENAKMYVWDETIASRGSQEIASCILKHIQDITTQKHVIAYSDACTGQNRNINIALIWLKIVQSSDNNVETVDHKFMVSGHSFLPNDRDFGLIETKIKKSNYLYIPEHYYNLIEVCKKKNPFLEVQMAQKNFISTKQLKDSTNNRKKNTNGEAVSWLKIQWIRFLKNSSYKMFYKTSLDDNSEFKILDLSPKIGRPRIYENIDLPPLYTTIRPITKEKHKDMMDLLPYIPPIFHKHYFPKYVLMNNLLCYNEMSLNKMLITNKNVSLV